MAKSKSLLLLIDGYNVIAPVASPGSRGRFSLHRSNDDWLRRERDRLLSRLVEGLPHRVRARTCVVFDASGRPGDRPDHYEVDAIDVRFAVDHPEADDLLEEIIAAHHSPKQLAVVSSDRRVRQAAERRGGTAFESQAWLDRLIDGRVDLVSRPPSRSRPFAGQSGRSAAVRGDVAIGDGPPAGESLRPAGESLRPAGEPLRPAEDVPSAAPPGRLSVDEVQDWLREFGLDDG